MAADNPSYRYDRLEGDATVAQNPEERRTRQFLYTALAISSLVNILFIVKWFVSFSEESHLLTISRSSYGRVNFSSIYVPKLTTLQQVFSTTYQSRSNGVPSTVISIIPNWMSFGSSMGHLTTAWSL